MYIKEINQKNHELIIDIPLTTTSGKTRIKDRSKIYEYGIPHAGRTKPFLLSNYVEWQIGYDADISNEEKMSLTSLTNINFIAYNGKTKALYELSEYLYYFHKWSLITRENLIELKNFLESVNTDDLIDSNKDCKIYRSHPTPKTINGIIFDKSEVIYPLLVHKFGKYEIIAEIIIKEKQYASGIQPMLYFCFPITELKSNSTLVGRTAETKEFAHFYFNKDNYKIIFEMIKIFGILSEAHRYDVIEIIKTILKF